MKSTDKFVLVLVASLALLLAGCGGGSSNNMPEPTEPTVDPVVAERAAINSAIMTARSHVPGVDNDSTDSEVSAAEMAIADARAAIAAAANVPAEEKAANTATVDTLETQLNAAKTARMAAKDAANKAAAEAMAKVGKALHAALGPPDVAVTMQNALGNITSSSLSSAGLVIDAASGAGVLTDTTGPGGATAAVDPASVTLEAGDAAGSLGSWMGMDYALTSGTGDSKVTNEARVYSNRGAPKSIPFANDYSVATTGPQEGYLDLSSTATGGGGGLTVAAPLSMATAFTHSGTQNHKQDTDIPGTFDGASGHFLCSGGACTTTNDGKGSLTAFDGTWHFKPGGTAMLSRPDTEYLYYGWWVSKDKDGGPTAASAFAGVVEPNAGDLDTGGDLTAITGSAKYAGHAAGKFAMSNTLDGTGNGGHFTADANLEATFGTVATAGVTGTIDNFRLNDGSDDPGWSVSLARGALGSSGGTITAPTSNPTVWSVNGNKAPASGTWSGTMYDEMPGNAPDGDGSNVPTTVTGTFYSEFGAIGRMVGAFGADKE